MWSRYHITQRKLRNCANRYTLSVVQGEGSGSLGRRPTIKDVARLAGVGSMTVSRVVRDAGYVSAGARERVERAVEELGYLPNHQARGLRLRRSGTIALIVADITNPYFTTLARGVEDAARPEGSLLLLGSSDESEEEELRYMNLLVQRSVDGVILVPSCEGAAALELAKSKGIPAMVADRRAPAEFDSVRCDSISGAAQAAQHLLSLGHRRAVVLAGRLGTSTSDERVEGFSREFVRGGGSVRALHGELTAGEGRRLASLAIHEGRSPSCLFAVNNFLAIGALQELSAQGLSVPGEVSVVGYDDLPAAMLASPFLTAVVQPAYVMGFAAGQRLMQRIARHDLAPQKLLLPVDLQIRGSTAAVRPRSDS